MKKTITILIVLILAGATITSKAGAVTIADLTAQLQALQAQLVQLQTQQRGMTATATATACVFTQNLYLGVRSEQVKCLQQYLNTAGYTVSASGVGSSGNESAYFGAKTKTAVSKWQVAKGVLPASGYFGAISRTKYVATNSAATSGATTSVVTTNQPSFVATSTSTNISSVAVATTSPLFITTTSIPSATAGVPYSVDIVPSGSNGSYSWWISAGSLPPGLNLVPTRCVGSSCSTNATVFGTPVTAWTYNFTVTVTSGTQVALREFTLIINPSVATLKISPTATPSVFNAGQTFEIQALYTPAPNCYPTDPCGLPDTMAVKVTWTSSNNTVATVAYKFYDSTGGVITAVSPGSATITANYIAGNINLTATIPVFVTGTIGTRLQISPTAPSVSAGKTISLQASYYLPTVCSSGSCASGGSLTVQVTWTSSNNAVVTIAYKSDDPKTAIITGISPGVTTITAVMGYNPTVGSSLTATTGLVVTPVQ
ncbi:MAG: peptidoglycan-binding domain-containing protein [Candidatus Azambacteria bacterium]|nr:peptidoglycan-binding domain-containing protein [Candidatus Azambacteria bacterium]